MGQNKVCSHCVASIIGISHSHCYCPTFFFFIFISDFFLVHSSGSKVTDWIGSKLAENLLKGRIASIFFFSLYDFSRGFLWSLERENMISGCFFFALSIFFYYFFFDKLVLNTNHVQTFRSVTRSYNIEQSCVEKGVRKEQKC